MRKSKKLVLTELPKERMHPVPEHPGYFITRSGRIFSVKQLSLMPHSDGYLRVSLYGSKRGKKRLGVHQLLARTFLKKPANANEVRHLDGNKANYSLGNIAWGTRKQNAADMARHGSLRGEKNAKAKLNEKQVLNIRRRHAAGKETKSALARAYGVTFACIKDVVSRTRWTHI